MVCSSEAFHMSCNVALSILVFVPLGLAKAIHSMRRALKCASSTRQSTSSHQIGATNCRGLCALYYYFVVHSMVFPSRNFGVEHALAAVARAWRQISTFDAYGACCAGAQDRVAHPASRGEARGAAVPRGAADVCMRHCGHPGEVNPWILSCSRCGGNACATRSSSARMHRPVGSARQLDTMHAWRRAVRRTPMLQMQPHVKP